MNRRRSRAIITSAGSSDTDEKAFTVIPAGFPPSNVVTTLMPVAKWPMTWRNSSGRGSIAVSLRGGRRRALRSAEAREALADDAVDPLEVGAQDRGPVGREPIRPAAVLGRQALDQAARLEARRSEEHTSELQSLRHLVC